MHFPNDTADNGGISLPPTPACRATASKRCTEARCTSMSSTQHCSSSGALRTCHHRLELLEQRRRATPSRTKWIQFLMTVKWIRFPNLLEMMLINKKSTDRGAEPGAAPIQLTMCGREPGPWGDAASATPRYCRLLRSYSSASADLRRVTQLEISLVGCNRVANNCWHGQT